MANWTFSWKPQYTYTFGIEQKTEVSIYESGKEQRRRKWTTPRYRFVLVWNNVEKTTADSIREFFEDREGRYDAFTFPNYSQSIKGTRLACVNSNPDTITDSSSGFVSLGFVAGQDVTINGSDSDNDGVYDIATVAAGTLTLEADEALTAESSNADLEIFRTYTVRFNSDSFEQSFVAPDVATIRTLELIEVI